MNIDIGFSENEIIRAVVDETNKIQPMHVNDNGNPQYTCKPRIISLARIDSLLTKNIRMKAAITKDDKDMRNLKALPAPEELPQFVQLDKHRKYLYNFI